MFSSLLLAIEQLGDPRIRSVIIRSALISVAIFIALVLSISWALSSMSLLGIGWLGKAAVFLGSSAAFIISLFIFPALTGLIISLMLEDVARAVEARHYPDLPEARREPVLEMVANSVRFASITIVLNLLVFVFVIPILLFTFILTPLIPAIFYALNGYLLGREYFEFAAARRMDPATSRAFRRRHQAQVFVYGIVTAVLMTVPFLNWIMPVIAAANMVHLFEKTRRRSETV